MLITMSFFINKIKSLFTFKTGGVVPKPAGTVSHSVELTSTLLPTKDLVRNAVTNIVAANVALAEVIFRLKSESVLPSDATFYIKPRKCEDSVVGYCIVEFQSDKCIYCKGM